MLEPLEPQETNVSDAGIKIQLTKYTTWAFLLQILLPPTVFGNENNNDRYHTSWERDCQLWFVNNNNISNFVAGDNKFSHLVIMFVWQID